MLSICWLQMSVTVHLENRHVKKACFWLLDFGLAVDAATWRLPECELFLFEAFSPFFLPTSSPHLAREAAALAALRCGRRRFWMLLASSMKPQRPMGCWHAESAGKLVVSWPSPDHGRSRQITADHGRSRQVPVLSRSAKPEADAGIPDGRSPLCAPQGIRQTKNRPRNQGNAATCLCSHSLIHGGRILKDVAGFRPCLWEVMVHSAKAQFDKHERKNIRRIKITQNTKTSRSNPEKCQEYLEMVSVRSGQHSQNDTKKHTMLCQGLQ